MAEILHLENEFLEIKGATKVVSSTNSQAVVEAGVKTFVITGSGIEVKKLSLEDGEVAFGGNFSNIKISQSQDKKTFFKRLFK